MGEGAERSGTAERNGTERRSVPAERNGAPFRSGRNGTERNGGVSEMGRNGTERSNPDIYPSPTDYEGPLGFGLWTPLCVGAINDL